MHFFEERQRIQEWVREEIMIFIRRLIHYHFRIVLKIIEINGQGTYFALTKTEFRNRMKNYMSN